MTVLPIVERELRVAARRRTTYWVRLAIALVGMGVGAVIFVITFGLTVAQTGRVIFESLAGLLLLYCLAYGRRATADCLSQERREGTLGLLFLTDLKGHDVVLGKLVATSLNGFYGLLAVFPVLAIPMLMGGITNAELWRMVLVLVNTFLFSLAIGMLGSALTRDFKRAMAANFLLLLLFIGVPPACMFVIGSVTSFSGKPVLELLLSCPAYAFYLCSEAHYKVAPVHFWLSVGVTHGLTWMLVLLASRIVPRSWQDKPARAEKRRWREFWRAWSYGNAEKQDGFRKRLLNVNAFYWLAARAQRKPVHVWTFMACMAGWWVVGWSISGRLWLDSAVAVLTALLLNSTLKVWVAIEAGAQLADDQKTGAFELLLSAPLTVGDILRGQWLALRRQFLKPLITVLALEVFFLVVWLGPSEGHQDLAIWLAGMAMLVLDVVALSWVGMSRALIARSHNSATISTLIRVLVLPWAAFGAVLAFGHVWYGLALNKTWSPSWQFQLGLWIGSGLAADVGFGLFAWWQLRYRFRELALRRFNPKPERSVQRKKVPTVEQPTEKPSLSHAAVWSVATSGTGKEASLRGQFVSEASGPKEPGKAPTPKKAPGADAHGFRRLVPSPKLALILTGLALLAGGIVSFLVWPSSNFPPPLAVTLRHHDSSIRVFPGSSGAFFILPDGSLWRWGMAGAVGMERASVPEQVGTNRDWVEVVAAHTHAVGLRRDGTIWEWGGYGGKREPRLVDSGHDWTALAASMTHAVALRRDGTLWAWGENSMNQLGLAGNPFATNANGATGYGMPGAGPFSPATITSPVQVGTNNDWAAVCCPWASTMAVRKDGSLWAWGSVYVFSSGRGTMNRLATPTQVCLETNWAGLVSGTFPLVRTHSGELWEPIYGAPNSEASIGAVGRLVVSNAIPGRVATAFCGSPKIFQIRADGALWERGYISGTSKVPLSSSTDLWRRVGKRSDWVSLWGGGGTAFGLTSDGTLWTWGVDPSGHAVPDFMTKIKTIQGTVTGMFGTGPTFRGGIGYAFQKEPRPVLRLVYTP
jgi:hypothetical protein